MECWPRTKVHCTVDRAHDQEQRNAVLELGQGLENGPNRGVKDLVRVVTKDHAVVLESVQDPGREAANVHAPNLNVHLRGANDRDLGPSDLVQGIVAVVVAVAVRPVAVDRQGIKSPEAVHVIVVAVLDQDREIAKSHVMARRIAVVAHDQGPPVENGQHLGQGPVDQKTRDRNAEAAVHRTTV